MPEFVTVAKAAEVAPGTGRVVEARGRSVALFNVGGRYYALANDCAHRGGPLGEGDLEGAVVTCPWHGWQWDVTTGKSLFNPDRQVACFAVRVEGDDVQVEI